MRRLLILASVAWSAALAPSLTAQRGGSIAATRVNIPYADAAPIFQALSQNRWPPELQGRTPAGIESAWPRWVERHDEQIRARLARGDEDSLINLLLFGATFTPRQRVKESELIGRPAGHHSADIIAGALVQGRLDDFIAALASPGGNERLQFARQVVERQGVDPDTAAGRVQARQYLTERLTRVLDEYERFTLTQSAGRRADRATSVADQLTLFRDRGLSSDTSILPDFAIDHALRALEARRGWEGRVRRVAIVGPGLDFTDKREGYDFYPPQTLQPFAIIDSLVQLGLAAINDLTLTTFDVSPRINQHLEAARERARHDDAYVLQLPRNLEGRWRPDLVAYWEHFGTAIGAAARPARPPPAAGRVRVRAISVRPQVVLAVAPQDLDIVLQRIEPAGADERFDLVVATNVLVYYDLFEQCLALTNIAKMLRPGGIFLTNGATFEVPGSELTSTGYSDVAYTDVPNRTDRVFWFRRR